MSTKMVTPFAGGAIVSILGTLLVMYLTPGASMARDKKDIEIVYEVDAGQTMLVVTAPVDDNCTNSGKKTGCFKIKKNKTGLIKYTFSANDGWYLKQFTICSGDSKITTACDNDLTLAERLEFFVMDDAKGSNVQIIPESGEVDLVQFLAGSKTFYLLDQNTINRTYFYNIQACNDDVGCLTLDPPVENKGLK